MALLAGLKKKFLNTSLEMSHPSVRVVHGVPVKKRPMRAYMDFARQGGDLVPYLIDQLFPGMSGMEVFTKIAFSQGETLKDILKALLVDAPPLLMTALASLLDVPEAALFDDPEVGPNQLWDILKAFGELNDLTDFFGRVSKRSPRP